MGSDHCIHGRGGAFRVCSVLRSRPLEPPPPAAPSPGSARTLGPHTVPLRPPGPHAAPPLILPSHFQRLKCLFFGQGRKQRGDTTEQHSREGTEAGDREGRWTREWKAKHTRTQRLQRASIKMERKTRVERDREALSRCGAGAAGGSWDSVGGRQALVWLLGERTAPEMGGGWSLTQGEGPPGLRLTSLAFGTRGLVEGPSAVLGATEAGYLDVLDGELIVICDLLVDIDVLL